MGKRKSDSELVRFSWKRNKKYDFLLLSEVQSRNPFVFKNPKPVWDEIAKTLQENSLKMKVTFRSCRDRVNELLKMHRRNERRSNAASGIAEPEETEIEKLLTEIVNLQATPHDAQVHKIYARNDKSEAESVRDAALSSVQSDDSDDDDVNFSVLPSLSHDNLPTDSNDGSIINDDATDILACDDAGPNLVVVSQDAKGTDSTYSDNVLSATSTHLGDIITAFDVEFDFDNGIEYTSYDGPATLLASQASNSKDDCPMSNDPIEINDDPIEINDDPIEIIASTSCASTSVRKTNVQGSNVSSSCVQGTKAANTAAPQNKKPTSCSSSKSISGIEETANLKIFFSDGGDLREDPSEKMITKSGRKVNPKQDLVRYLENKSEKELDLRKDEMDFRKVELKTKEKSEAVKLERELDIRKEETAFRVKEIDIKKKETENKSKELEILYEKAKGENENQKRMTDLLMSLVNRMN